jgi:hypothetical protein
MIATAGFIALNFGNWLSSSADLPMPADVIISLGGDDGERVKTASSP